MSRFLAVLFLLYLSSNACVLRVDTLEVVKRSCEQDLATLRAEALTQALMGTLQDYSPPTGSIAAARLHALEEHVAEKIGVFVVYAPLKKLQMWGATPFHREAVIVEVSLSPDGRLEVLAHELGHLFHPLEWEKVPSEAFAETVGMLLQLQLGIQGRYPYGIQYLRTIISAPDYLTFTVAHQDALCAAVAKILPGDALEAN